MNEELNVMEQGMEPVRDIEVITQEILFYKQQAGAAILEIGTRLIEAKQALQHGEWQAWLEERVDFSVRTAQRFMKVAEGYGKSDTVTLLGTRKALALLALEPDEREEFLNETHLVEGVEKTAVDMTAAELEKAIRERDEAKKKTEMMAQHIEDQKRTYEKVLAGARAQTEKVDAARAELAAKVEELELLTDGLVDDVDKKDARVEELEQELKELRERPVDVAVQEADPAELDKAREEGAEEVRAELTSKLEQAKAEAQAKLDKAKAELEQATAKEKESREKVEDLLKRLAQAEENAERIRKEAAVSGNEDLAAFKIHFAAVQSGVNELAKLLTKMDGEGRTEEAGKLRQALGALANAVQAVAGAG